MTPVDQAAVFSCSQALHSLRPAVKGLEWMNTPAKTDGEPTQNPIGLCCYSTKVHPCGVSGVTGEMKSVQFAVLDDNVKRRSEDTKGAVPCFDSIWKFSESKCAVPRNSWVTLERSF